MKEKIRKVARLLTTPQIYSFISPSIDIASDVTEYWDAIQSPDENIVKEYETQLSRFLGGGDVVTFASGRMSFYALLESWGIKQGDEVALTGFTCAVMANAVLRVGAIPIYVDIDKDTLGMSPKSLTAKISSRTKVIVAQHSFGIPCEIEKIKEIAELHGCFLVEDCALSLGSKYKGTILGNFGDAAIFSTDHTKPLNTLIGGFVYTKRKDVAHEVRKIHDEASNLSAKHQQLILRQYSKEHQIETSNHKLYILHNYWNALKKKLHIDSAVSPFLLNDASSVISENAFYHYPAKLPPVLAKLGINVLSEYEKSIDARKAWKDKVLAVLKDKENLPSAYYDENSDIIPLRIAYVSNRPLFDFGYIDDWIWFKTPIVATLEPLENFGYHTGMCPISEKVGQNIMNIPVLLQSSKQEKFLKTLNKTYSYGI